MLKDIQIIANADAQHHACLPCHRILVTKIVCCDTVRTPLTTDLLGVISQEQVLLAPVTIVCSSASS